jgi:hypothetical protein
MIRTGKGSVSTAEVLLRIDEEWLGEDRSVKVEGTDELESSVDLFLLPPPLRPLPGFA